MTNYDMTMDMLAASTFHPDSVEQAREYLRDLKASHDRLLDIGQKYTGHLGSCSVFYEELCDCGFADSTNVIKAAEALR